MNFLDYETDKTVEYVLYEKNKLGKSTRIGTIISTDKVLKFKPCIDLDGSMSHKHLRYAAHEIKRISDERIAAVQKRTEGMTTNA